MVKYTSNKAQYRSLCNVIHTGVILKNFLDALDVTGTAKKPKRVILTTGAKQYIVHLGPPQEPDGGLGSVDRQPSRPPNVYHHQQNILKGKVKNAS